MPEGGVHPQLVDQPGRLARPEPAGQPAEPHLRRRAGLDHRRTLSPSPTSATSSSTSAIYSTDALNGDGGGFELLPGDQAPTDVGSWVQVAQENLTVPPGMEITLPITITVPPDARPGDHVGGIVASSPGAGRRPRRHGLLARPPDLHPPLPPGRRSARAPPRGPGPRACPTRRRSTRSAVTPPSATGSRTPATSVRGRVPRHRLGPVRPHGVDERDVRHPRAASRPGLRRHHHGLRACRPRSWPPRRCTSPRPRSPATPSRPRR